MNFNCTEANTALLTSVSGHRPLGADQNGDETETPLG